MGLLGAVERSAAGPARPPARRRDAFSGAIVNRLTADWIAQILSADQELRSDLRRLRARGRQLFRDTPFVQQFVRLLTNNVVGPRGMRLQARLQNALGKPDRDRNTAIEASWRQWGRPATATVHGRYTWCDVERLALATVAIEGEFLARKRRGARNAWAYTLQLLDPDLLDETYERAPATGLNRISMGVELDPDGRPVAYHLWTAHPNDVNAGYVRERIRVPADEILHVMRPWRIGQTRGVPWFTPVMLALKMLDGYLENELVASRAAAGKMGFITTNPEHAEGYQPPPDGETRLELEMEPGLMTQLAPGQSFVGWDPEHPTAAFGDYVTVMTRILAAGMGASYAGLTTDLSDANYSSLRDGRQQERDGWRELQVWYATQLHAPVYEDWLPFAVLTGQVELPTMEVARWAPQHDWQARGWGWVDPAKDAEAAAKDLAMGLVTRTQLCAERGRDFEENLAQLRDERELAAEYGITLLTPVAGAPADQETEDDDTGTGAGSGREAADDAARSRHHLSAGRDPRRRLLAG